MRFLHTALSILTSARNMQMALFLNQTITSVHA